jgi:hypothetical protein
MNRLVQHDVRNTTGACSGLASFPVYRLESFPVYLLEKCVDTLPRDAGLCPVEAACSDPRLAIRARATSSTL